MGKWKWILLNDQDALWRVILAHWYADLKNNMLSHEFVRGGKKYSIWWKDLFSTGRNQIGNSSWFAENLSYRLEKGTVISF